MTAAPMEIATSNSFDLLPIDGTVNTSKYDDRPPSKLALAKGKGTAIVKGT
jgi:hypothetical protein